MINLFSPAKVNLFLRVMGRREDGYHEIASLFQTVSLGDSLDFSLHHSDHLTSTHPALATDESNLVFKAANCFRKKSGLSFGIKVHLEKRIPLGAGLGGGSSNAATTLWALNELQGRPFSFYELRLLAGEIGSDVPFFFSSGTAFCTGRGEKVESLPPLPPLPSLWLLLPSFGVSTPSVYAVFKKEKASTKDPRNLLSDFLSGKIHFVNDLEEPALSLSPELHDLKKELFSRDYKKTMLTGSGSGIIVEYDKSPLLSSLLSVHPLSFCQRESEGWYRDPSK